MTPDEISKLIPDEVVEAAAIDLRGGWGEADEAERDAYRVAARAAIAAGLAAWPGAHEYNPNAEPFYGYHLILPLTQKDATDE
jgi:hypothetical protein